MKRTLWIAAIIALAAAIIGYRELSQGVGRRVERGSGIAREVPVKLAAVQKGPIAYILNTSGDVLPLMQVDVVSRISGYVERIHFEIGDRVAAGQVVATVDQKEQLHRVEEEEATVKVAEASLREKESQLADSERQAERARLLRQKDFISSQELDAAETRAHTAKAQRELAQAQLAQRQATLAQSRYMLGLTRVTAPFSGVVTRRLIDPGAHVSSASPILTLAVPDPLKVIVNISEKDVSLVRAGMVAKLEIDAFPGQTFEGKIARLNSALDPASRTLMAEVHVPNPQRLLKPGMFARVALVLAEHKDALLVPTEAIVEEEGDTSRYVYTIAGDRAKRIVVTPGWTQDSLTEITKGLVGGEQIVVSGQQRLRPEMKVRVLEEKVRQ
jgi:RND family efflux transporter MFP subunit